MNLARALRAGRAVRLALVGAGGKTTALFQLAHELATPPGAEPGTVLVTTTTHLGTWQAQAADHHFILESAAEVDALRANLPAGVLLCTGPVEQGAGPGRLPGPDPEALAALLQLAEAHGLALLVEADGARGLPLKAPAAHEPAIPAWVEQVVVVAGLSGLGQPLALEVVHRPERFAALAGLAEGQTITPAALAAVLAHPEGGLKGIPQGARRSLLLSQADTELLQAQGGGLAASCLRAGHLLGAFHGVVVAGFQPGSGEAEASRELFIHAAHEPAAGILLAAGGAQRFGQPWKQVPLKQLLPWGEEPLVRHAAGVALQAGLNPVIVVVGAHAGPVRQALEGLAVQIVENAAWQAGQSGSVRAGVAALPAEVGAAVFLLADQPYVSAPLVQALVELHSGSLAPLVAPMVGGQRSNPVLFDRDTFGDLLALEGDQGGRALFSRYPVQWLPWHDVNLLLDIDTLEDYQRLTE